MRGRMAMGSGLILVEICTMLRGVLTGNGPYGQQHQLWIDSGWKPRYKIGDAFRWWIVNH